ncbi:hypothetical protein CFO_g4824 [Ceratocystis platani]|uniref:PPM-type phosphatase domain-containing protein n=1 Tax=Ceratocystis fimbriata f. sp. platani TaxID=88771 RepID=A0A0F8B0B0_CERFI|nr:hypothetical protein CFO_g4824 [Ceratocystis platani]
MHNFLGHFLAPLLATGLLVCAMTLDQNAKMYQPFALLARREGACAEDSLTLKFYGLHAVLTPFRLLCKGLPLTALTTLLMWISWVLIAVSAEAVHLISEAPCKSGDALCAALSLYSGRRGGLLEYGIAPGESTAALRPTNNDTDDPPAPVAKSTKKPNFIDMVKDAVAKDKRQPFFALSIRARLLFILYLVLLVAWIGYYTQLEDAKDRMVIFMNSGEFGPKFLLAMFGVVVAVAWTHVYQSIAILGPFLVIKAAPHHAETSVLVTRASNAYLGLWDIVSHDMHLHRIAHRLKAKRRIQSLLPPCHRTLAIVTSPCIPAFAKRGPVSVQLNTPEVMGEATNADSAYGDPQVFYFGVFDGHGGTQCSDFLRDELHGYIEEAAVTLGLQSSLKKSPTTGSRATAAASAIATGTDDNGLIDPPVDPLPLCKDLVQEYKQAIGGYFRRFVPRYFVDMYQAEPPIQTTIESVLMYSFLRADLDFVKAQARLPEHDSVSHDRPLNSDEYLGEPNHVPPSGHGIGTNARPVTSDHRPSMPSEERRLRRYAPATSLVSGDSFGEERIAGLANSRAFGDVQSKRIGVSAEPDITRIEMGPAEYSFLVLVSDGVSGTLSDQEIVDVVKEAKTPEQGAQDIVDYATEVSSNGDNATCLVVRLGGWERRQEGGVGSFGTKEIREVRRSEAMNPRMRRQ